MAKEAPKKSEETKAKPAAPVAEARAPAPKAEAAGAVAAPVDTPHRYLPWLLKPAEGKLPRRSSRPRQ